MHPPPALAHEVASSCDKEPPPLLAVVATGVSPRVLFFSLHVTRVDAMANNIIVFLIILFGAYQ